MSLRTLLFSCTCSLALAPPLLADPLPPEQVREIVSTYNKLIAENRNAAAVAFASEYFPPELYAGSVRNGRAVAIRDIQIENPPSDAPREGQIYARVTKTYTRETNELYQVLYENGEKIETTREHPFMISGKGWVPASKLQRGDPSLLASGQILVVASVTRLELSEPVKVYNFEVAGAHDYYVGSSGILVHNECSNFTNQTIFTKPGNAKGPVAVAPGTTSADPSLSESHNRFDKPDNEDGVADPAHHPRQVFKVPGRVQLVRCARW